MASLLAPPTFSTARIATANERSRMRRQRLRLIELEQRIEDQEALKMTDSQRQTLLRSFTSVKTEFSDLDGLSWPLHSFPRTTPYAYSYKKDRRRVSDAPFAILSNAELAAFAPEDTIRASASRSRSSSPAKELFDGSPPPNLVNLSSEDFDDDRQQALDVGRPATPSFDRMEQFEDLPVSVPIVLITPEASEGQEDCSVFSVPLSLPLEDTVAGPR